ncbi:hypothetical protein GBL_2207 [Geobacillus kaustophilus GBlys]|uniref:Uncharacterized protein n=1 Tax=Geobacillus kaustophilus GBlys TaxID=1337888 RepID=U2X518_GEOKU|nr:hypothetical protein GBL_2207 [Geobacillus kaustophilus GBlys]
MKTLSKETRGARENEEKKMVGVASGWDDDTGIGGLWRQ